VSRPGAPVAFKHMRATSADGALRGMPDFKPRRSAPATVVASFADQLTSRQTAPPPVRGASRISARPTTSAPRRAEPPAEAPLAPGEPPGTRGPGRPSAPGVLPPPPLDQSRAAILQRAASLLGVPYVWGGDAVSGMDCSAYVSRVWGVSRQTTDTLQKVSDPIAKAELRSGDALNLPTWKDPSRHGHVRLFDRWDDPGKTRMWVYEETAEAGGSVHRVIPYDDRYQPMRLRGLAA
jgi:cell wall-associated NlpC family hydrolase